MPPRPRLVLRVAAVWGTDVLAVQNLEVGESVAFAGAWGLPRPEGVELAEVPLRAVGTSWRLDPQGATGGSVKLTGTRHDPVMLKGQTPEIIPGDHGLLRCGDYALFFQLSAAPPKLAGGLRVEVPVLLAALFALILVVGGLLLVRAIMPPRIAKPIELETRQALARRLSIKLAPEREQKHDQPQRAGQDTSVDMTASLHDLGIDNPVPAPMNGVPPVELAGATIETPGQGLTPQQIHRTVSLYRNSFAECRSSQSATVTIDLSITAPGVVKELRIAEGHPEDLRFARCVVRRFKNVTFPAARLDTNASYKVAFRPE